MDSAPAPVLLDISRLIGRAHRRGPSGIDRVELAYAQYFLAADARRPAYAVVHLFGWLFGVNPLGARRFVERLAARWQGGALAGGSRAFDLVAQYATLLTGHWSAGFQLRRRLKKHDEPPIFLVVSHHHLSRAHMVRRIRRSFGARCVCFLHDLIPIDYPEYFHPGKEQEHRRVTETISRFFDAVIVNSQTTAESFRHFLSSPSEQTIPAANIHVAPPGVGLFPRPSRTPDVPHSVPYFIVLGTIEPRKNHMLLLNLWGRLATTMATPPRLLVIGARGWENEQVVDMLERSHRLHGLVEEHNRLDDLGVGSLLSQARAVLVPSFVEGFGLPLAEALASGVPVICSDIPEFREIGRNVPDYADPLDLLAWRDHVVDYSRADSTRRAAQTQRLAHWPPPSWPDHFEIVERVLDEVASSARVSP